MKKYLGAWVLALLIFSPKLQAQESVPLDDLMSPDEIAAEAGFPRTEIDTLPHIQSLEDMSFHEGLDLLRTFPTVLVINKKAAGPGAQRLSLYEEGIKTQEWMVSTGRERWENAKSGRRYFSITPTGWYYPHTLVRSHWSQTWKAKMEFAIFFNGGVAVHATTPDHYRELGSRASGGCVRLHYKHAEYIYNRIKTQGKGLVPVFRRDGQIQRDRRGGVMYNTNWKTLIVVVE